MKFKSNIELQAGVEAGGSTGSSGQVLSSTGSGVSWIDQNAIRAGNAEHVVIYAKNTHTASIAKGTPVYITGTVGATDTVEIAPADASDSAKMPAVGLLDETLAVNAFGYVVTGGFMDNITTDPIDGTTPSSNDTVYVKAGGGLTLTKPTGPTGLIQNVAKVGKVSGGNSGSLIVSSILRTNDVPNLTTGKIWVGDGNTVESTVVHLDEVNGRMGIGTTSPAAGIHVNTSTLAARFVSSQSTGLEVQGGGNSQPIARFKDITASEKVTISSTGNVGIGDNSPSEKLYVAGGNIRLDDGYEILWDSSGSVYGGQELVLRAGNTDSKIILDGGDFKMSFITQNSTAIVIDDAQNVGIGTTSPSQKLHVDGNILATGDIISGGSITIGSSGAYNAGSIYSDANWGMIFRALQADPNFADFMFANSENVERLRITSNGNVGIGTTNPLSLLSLGERGSTNGDLRLSAAGSGANEGASILWDMIVGGGNSISHISEIRPESYATGVNKNILNFYVGGWNNNQDSGTAKMTITSDGNVGIGTTNPTEKLHIRGIGTGIKLFSDFPAESENSTTLNHISFQKHVTGGPQETIKIYNVGTFAETGYSASDLRLAFNDNAGGGLQDKVTFKWNGNVGIGTTSPGSKLNINHLGFNSGSTTSVSALMVQGSYGGGITISDTAESGFFADTGGTNLRMYVGKTASDTPLSKVVMTATSSGDVGIGETSPSEKLDVNGTVKATDYKGYLPAFHHGSFYHNASTNQYSIYWLPTNSVNEVTTSQYYNNWIAPYDGRVKKIVMRWASGSTPTATSVIFMYALNGTTSLVSFPATVTNGASTDMTATKAFGDTDITFNAGDKVQLGFRTDGGTRFLYGFAYTIVLEYNKD